MTVKFQSKYRIASSRLSNWDYGSNAMYFITICTQSRENSFGEIVDGTMNLSDIGKIAMQCWKEIPTHFPFVELGEFVVMPDHVHGIIIIGKPDGDNRGGRDHRDGHDGCRDAINRVSTTDTPANTDTPAEILNDIQSELIPPLENIGGFAGSKNPMLNDNLSRIIRWYKGRASFETRKINKKFAWQSRFHDRIIRDDKAFHQISNYIKNNPLNWRETDYFN